MTPQSPSFSTHFSIFHSTKPYNFQFVISNNKDTDDESSPAEICMGMHKQGRISSIGYSMRKRLTR